MIKVLTGDILASKMQAKVNTVNCIGVMGKGIAQLFKKQYPEMFEDYVDRCNSGEVEEGVPYVYTDLFGNKIVNFPTKNHWKGLSNIESIRKGLDIIIDKYREWGIESIAFPPLGCGNGGLLWQVVGPIMYQRLTVLDIPIEIYAPLGTDRKYLKAEFLGGVNGIDIKARITDKEIPGTWIAILEVIHRLEKMSFTVPVGKIVFQKICYMATLLNMDLDIQFKKGTYGPYSPGIERMYNVFGRENLIKETKLNNHTKIESGVEYIRLRTRQKEVIEQHETKISRLVDLFCRVKSAAHAEEIGTIMFALSELTDNGRKEFVTEMDFYDYVLNWKKEWDTQQKKESLASTIRYLASTEWVNLNYSDELVNDYLNEDSSK